ncbi:leucine-rich repeat domain-containing protein [Aliivibrio logei]|uniref:leucine-rich repeat domain-containing protein n=1 Tax=Aliivibrio logei TaxID=688 RepID=UPI0035C8EEFB
MKEKSNLTRGRNQTFSLFIVFLLFTFSKLLQASSLSKEEQAQVVILTSPTAQKLQKLADDIGTDIYFYVEGLTAHIGPISSGDIDYVTPSIVLNTGEMIIGTEYIPKISVLLNQVGDANHAVVSGNALLSELIITNLKKIKYLTLWNARYDFEYLDLNEFNNLKGLEVMRGEIKIIDLPQKGQLSYIEIESGKLEGVNNFERQKKLNGLVLKTNKINDYKDLFGNKSLKKLTLVMGEERLDVSSMKNLVYLDLFYPKYEDVEKIEGLVNLEKLEIWWGKDDDLSKIKLPRSLRIIKVFESDKSAIMPLINLPNLKEVTFNGGDITQVPILEELPELETLEISDSKLTSLDGIEKLTSLKYVRFEKNEITDISALFPLESLVEIDLSDSKFKRLGYIGKKPHLDMIKLSDSELESVDFDAIAKYPYCSISIEFTPFEMNASDDDLNKIYNLWEKGHL